MTRAMVLIYHGWKMALLGFLHWLIVPALLIGGVTYGTYWAALIFAFLLTPLWDRPATWTRGGLTPRATLAQKIVFWLWVPTELVVFAWAMGVAAVEPLAPLQWLGFTLSLSVITGSLGITVSHELIHRRHRIEWWTGAFLLTLVHYGHFAIEHVQGHHVHVGTDRDPASAPKGMGVYRFWLRSVWGSYTQAWEFNRGLMFRLLALQVVIHVGVASVFGARAYLFFLAQGFVGFSFLEVLNYIQHYGLRRAEKSPGVFETVTPKHSWETAAWGTNTLLFNLGLHSAHHQSPTLRFAQLKFRPDAPSLPFGYPAALVVALIPPLWRKIMDPRIPRA